MKYMVEVQEIDKKLSLEQKERYEVAANQRLNELKNNDICGANYQIFDNALGNKVILKSGQLFEELIPTVTSTNAVEIHYDCAFGVPEGLYEKTVKPKKKIGRKPRNNTYEELTYFNLKDDNGDYIAIELRVKNHNCRKNGYNKYKSLHFAGLIDAVDLPFFQENRMRLSNGRLVIVMPGKGNVYVSRIIMARILTGEYDVSKLPKGLVVDHKDRNPLNNRAFNLRLVTPMENAINTTQVDKKIAIGNFYGLGIEKIDNNYQVKAYKMTEQGYEIAEIKVFEDLAVGQAWKNELEAKLISEFNQNEIPETVAA